MNKIIIFTKIIFILFFNMYSIYYSQEYSVRSVENNLVTLYGEIVQSPYELKDSLNKVLKTTLLTELLNKEILDFNFANLSRRISITNSKDNKLRIFSWNKHTGGSALILSAIAQYVDEKGDIRTQVIDTTKDLEAERNLLYNSIEEFNTGATKHYLTFGWGSIGAGAQYEAIRSFMIIDNKLKRDSIFAIGNGKTDVLLLVIPFPPSQLKPAHRNTLINFDPKFKLITYGEFIFSEEEDVAGVNTTFKEIKLKFSNGFFKKTR